MASIGSIFIDFVARTAELEAGIAKAVGLVDDGAADMGRAFGGVGAASDKMSESISSGITRSMPATMLMRMAFKEVVNEIEDVYKNIDSIPDIPQDVIESIHQMKFELEGSNSSLKQGIAQMESWFSEAGQGIGFALGAAVYGMDNAHEAAQKLTKDAEDYNNKAFAAEFQKEALAMDRLHESTGAYADALGKAAAVQWGMSESANTTGGRNSAALEAMQMEIEQKTALVSLDAKYAASEAALGAAENKVYTAGQDNVLTLEQLRERESELLQAMGELGPVNEQDGATTEKRIALNKQLTDTYDRIAVDMKKVKDPMDELRNSFVNGFEKISDTVSQFVVTGKADFSQFFTSLEEQILSTIIKLEIINPLLNGMFKGATGYQTQAAFSNTGASWASAAGGLVAGFLADGGPAQSGQPYIVGEEGPELFVPNGSGTVVPNGARLSSSGGGGGDFNIHYHIESGVTRNELAPILDKHSNRIKSDIASTIRRGGTPARAMGR